MPRKLPFALVVAVMWFGAYGSVPVPAEVSIPPALEDWKGWALYGESHRSCPFLSSSDPRDPASFRCTWPGRLTLEVDAQGGSFSQPWRVYAEGWAPVPGSAQNWPLDVRIDGEPGTVLKHKGGPRVWLPEGSHVVSGRFAWASRPEVLAVSPETGLVSLTVDGVAVAKCDRPGGTLWLGNRGSVEQPQQMDVRVYRLVKDDVPVQLVTRVGLQVSGEGREEFLDRVLPDGFIPMSLASELPARLDADGRLRLQVRPGTWEIVLTSRGANVAEILSRPPAKSPWPQQEIWSFAGNDRLRVAAAEGADGIDPVQANVPPDWRRFPAFRMLPDSTLRIVQRSRGLANADENRLTLHRKLWLDFDHTGFTAVDQIAGTMRSQWRLDMAEPYRLESALSGGTPLLVTDGTEPGTTGVELRNPQVNLTTVACLDRGSGLMPATGWQTRFEQAAGVLHMPPGHRLLAVLGVDYAPGSWIERWGLWNLFGVLVVVVFSVWVAGRVAGALALVGLLLMYQEHPGLVWLWGNLLAAVALYRNAPDGRFRRFARFYRTVSFIVLGLVLLPFAWSQVRFALYPQLEAGAWLPLETGAPVAVRMEEAPLSGAMMAPPSPEPHEVEVQQEISTVGSGVDGRAIQSSEVIFGIERKKSYGDRYVRQKAQWYAPGTQLQAGPGIPAWRFQTFPFGWSGPVEPGQTIRFLFIGPFLMCLWRMVGVGLLAVLFLRLLRQSFGWSWRPTGSRRVPGATAVAVLLLCLFATSARAESTPGTDVLRELKLRLTRPPDCTPTCAGIMHAQVAAYGDRLDVTLRVGALAELAVPVPSAGDRWQIDQVEIDGKPGLTVMREGDGSLWVPLGPGTHTVHIRGRLAATESVQLVFPQSPGNVSVSSQGWNVAGVSEGHLLSGSIELVRRRSVVEDERPLDGSPEFPSFVRVIRDFDLNVDWSINTTVERLAPVQAAIMTEVPLVAGESVLTEGVEVLDDRTALVALAPGQDHTFWKSVLSRGDNITLSMPEGTARTEVWNFVVNPQWNVTFAGFPAVLPVDPSASVWVYAYYPRPGESLELQVGRPEPAEGSTLAIDSVRHRIAVGKRSSSTTLEFNYRSTQGGRHTIGLPEDARVSAMTVDGTSLALRPEKAELSIGLLPGSHVVSVQWTRQSGPALRTSPEPVDLRAPASNVSTSLNMPTSRWVLAAFGQGVGPAVLYWGELVVFLVMAWLFGRSSRSPIRGWEWLLLGLGLSTLSWAVFAAMAAWFFVMQWREHWDGGENPKKFNRVQVLLALATVGAIGCLVFSGVRYGLLATPDMGICGPGTDGRTLTWFVDQTTSALPCPVVVSVPMWIYKALMFAWALWIALALARWLRWAWHAWTRGGLWRSGKESDSTAA